MINNMNYAVFGCRDLKEAIRFLTDFGLVVSVEQPGCVYFRGTEGRPYLLVMKQTEKSGLIAAGYEVASEESLRAMAQRLGASVKPISDNPWGGLRAVTSDCDGNGIELVYGIQRVEPLPMPREEVVLNANGKMRRKGRLPVFDDAPTPVVRLCHVVHISRDVHRFIDWYVKNLGAYPSDILTNTQTRNRRGPPSCASRRVRSMWIITTSRRFPAVRSACSMCASSRWIWMPSSWRTAT